MPKININILVSKKELSKNKDESINSLDLSLLKGKIPKLLNPSEIKKKKNNN